MAMMPPSAFSLTPAAASSGVSASSAPPGMPGSSSGGGGQASAGGSNASRAGVPTDEPPRWPTGGTGSPERLGTGSGAVTPAPAQTRAPASSLSPLAALGEPAVKKPLPVVAPAHVGPLPSSDLMCGDVVLPLTIKERWKFRHRIGQGSFGAVFSGRDVRTKARVACKLEPVGPKRSLLKTEVALLKELQGTPHVCRYIASGCVNGYNYLIMELLADNLAQNFRTHRQSKLNTAIKNEVESVAAAAKGEPAAVTEPQQQPQQEARFTVSALTFTQVAFLGRQMIRAIQSLHEHGYLHRDVKPSNYALGLQPGKISNCYTIDFGLARRYLDEQGAHREPRPNPGFRGTARYASLNAHRNLELSRRDDLWSIFFIVFEFTVGVLPWAGLSGRDEIGVAKEQWLVDASDETGPSPINQLPHPLPAMFQMLNKLEYAECPDYDGLVAVFDHAGTEPLSDPSMDPPSDPITPASPPRGALAAMMPPAGVAVAKAAAVTAAPEPAPEPAQGPLCPRPPTHARPPSGRPGSGRPAMLNPRRNRFTQPAAASTTS